MVTNDSWFTIQKLHIQMCCHEVFRTTYISSVHHMN